MKLPATSLPLAGLGLLLSIACAPTPPPYWAEGGSSLRIPSAEWKRTTGDPVLVSPVGSVTRGGELVFNLDAAGRIFDEDNEPIAIVGPDGHVIGTDDEPLGRVGMRNASPPWSQTAWLRVAEDGTLLLFDGDGESAFGGSWTGCGHGAVRVCTLVSHLMLLQAFKRQMSNLPYNPVTFGVGVGVWY